MILGIGNDICDIRRVERILARYGERFEKRVFTPTEIAKARSRTKAGAKVIAGTYAKRFAAKEACSKALGTGIHFGIKWREMEVVNLPTGQPTMRLSGDAAARLATLTPNGHSAVAHVTLTDDYPYAQAIVMFEARVL